MPKHKQLAELAQLEAELHLITMRCQKEPRNGDLRQEQARLQTQVQVLRSKLFGRR